MAIYKENVRLSSLTGQYSRKLQKYSLSPAGNSLISLIEP